MVILGDFGELVWGKRILGQTRLWRNRFWENLFSLKLLCCYMFFMILPGDPRIAGVGKKSPRAFRKWHSCLIWAAVGRALAF